MLFSNMFGLVLAAIFSSTITDIHGRYMLYRPRPGVSGTVSHRKIVATWEEAKQRCEREGAVLASPIDEGLLEYMKSSIGVNNHTTPYFIGMKAFGNPELIFVSVEGVLLEHLPDGAIDMIDELEPTVGDCLSMDRNNIKIVTCRARLPYLCYIPNKATTEMTTEATTEMTTHSTTEATTEITTQATTEATTEVTTHATTEATTELTTQATTEATTEKTTQATTEATTEVTTQSTTEATTEKTTQATTEATTEVTTQSTTTAAPVVTGYRRFSTGSYYKLHLERKGWDDAEATCISEGADLVVINNEREADIVKRFAFSDTKSHWVIIGLRDFGEDGKWRSVHGEPIIQLYNTWAPSRSMDRFCGSLKKSGQLDDQLCGAKYPFVCERLALL